MAQSQLFKFRSKVGHAKQVTRFEHSKQVKQSQLIPKPQEMQSTTLLVGQLQSFEIVQTCLRAAISCLSYLRQLFPEECFVDRYYDNLNTNCSYDNFVNGEGDFGETDRELLAQKPRRPGSTLKLLVRGRDGLADTLLNWLEYGIFEAIELGYLAGLQLTIYADAQRPENVLETYTFTFQYASNRLQGKCRLSSIEVKSPTGEKVTIKEAKYGLQMLNMRLVALSTFLPQLPEAVFLTAHLFYTESCPNDYEPKGFRACASDNLFFPDDEQWKRQTESCGQMNTGFHSVRLRVSSLKWTAADTCDPEKSGKIPTDLTLYKQYSREGELQESNNSNRAQSTSSNLSQDINDVAASQSEPDLDLVEKRQEQSTLEDDTSATESLYDEPNQIRSDTNRAVLRQILENNDALRFSQDSDLVTTQQELLNPESHLESRLHRLSLRPVFSQKTVKELNFNRALLDRRELCRDDVPLHDIEKDLGENIKCQCGWGKEENEMLYCEFCDTWQHLHCYGYHGEHDPALPRQHICYECLLGPHETKQLKDLRLLCLHRKVFMFIYNEPSKFPQNEKAFARLFHCTIRDARSVINTLKSEGLISKVPIDQMAAGRSRQRQRQKWTVHIAPDTRLRMDKLYFDPTMKIAHHCITPTMQFDEISQEGLLRLKEPDLSEGPQETIGSEPSSDIEAQADEKISTGAEAGVLEPAEGNQCGTRIQRKSSIGESLHERCQVSPKQSESTCEDGLQLRKRSRCDETREEASRSGKKLRCSEAVEPLNMSGGTWNDSMH